MGTRSPTPRSKVMDFFGIGRSFDHHVLQLPPAAFIYPLLIPTATFTMSFTSEANFVEFKKRARVLIGYDIPFPMAVDLAAFFARFPNAPKVKVWIYMSYHGLQIYCGILQTFYWARAECGCSFREVGMWKDRE